MTCQEFEAWLFGPVELAFGTRAERALYAAHSSSCDRCHALCQEVSKGISAEDSAFAHQLALDDFADPEARSVLRKKR